MPDIILHVGVEKTGTTTIQEYLNFNYDSLIKKKVLYPQSLGSVNHMMLTACFLEKDPSNSLRKLLEIEDSSSFNVFKLKILSDFNSEIERFRPNTILISDEHINVNFLTPEDLNNFKQGLELFGNIKKVIIYLRRQIDFQLSIFSEAIKSGNMIGFDINNPLDLCSDEIPFRFRYDKILTYFSMVFGKDKLDVRMFDKTYFKNGDLLEDFISAADIDHKVNSGLIINKNRSLDAKIIKKVASLIKYLEDQKYQYRSVIKKDLLAKCEKMYEGNRLEIGSLLQNEFMMKFQEINRKVQEEYFGGKEVFSLKNLPFDEKSPKSEMSWEEFFIKYIFYKIHENIVEEVSMKILLRELKKRIFNKLHEKFQKINAFYTKIISRVRK